MGEKKINEIHIDGIKYNNSSTSSVLDDNGTVDITVSPLEYLQKNYPEKLNRILVGDIFYSKTFGSFNEFCKGKGIEKVKQLDCDVIEEFLENVEGESYKRKLEFKIENTFEEIRECFMNNFFELEYLKRYHKEICEETKIKDIFSERKYLLFNEFCEENSIDSVYNLDCVDLIRFGFCKSVGKKKKLEIVSKIEQFLLEILGENEEGCIYKYIKNTYPNDLKERKIPEVFKEYKYIMFRIYCSENDIESLYELDIDAQNSFFTMYELRENKKKMILDALKKEYLAIIKRNAILSKVIPENDFIEEDFEQKNIEKSYFKLESIEDILPDKYAAYEYMKEQLRDDGVENLLDLVGYDVSKLKRVTGVGEKRYAEFREYLEKKVRECREIVNIIKNDSFQLSDKIYNVVAEKTLREVIVALDLNEERKAYNLDEISQYQGVKYMDLDDYGLIKNLIAIKQNLEDIINVEKTIKELDFKNYSEIDRLILEDVVIKKEDVDIVGKRLGISGRKVEEIKKKIVDNINTALEKRKFSVALKIIYEDYRNMDMKKLYDYVDKEDQIIIDIIKANVISGVFYISDTDTMSYFQICAIMNNPKKEIEKSPPFGTIAYIKNVLQKYREIKVDEETFAELLRETEYSKILGENGVKLIDDYYYKENISKISLFEFYLRYYHQKPFRVSSKSAEEYNKFFKKKFDMDVRMNSRSLEGLGARSENIILVNPRTYSHIDLVGIDEVTVLHMKKILDLRLSKKECVNAKEIYEVMDEFYPGEFYSKHHVYSLINHYFDEYTTSKGNSLDITKKGKKIHSKTDVVYDLCKENNSIIGIKDLKEKTDWSMNRIYNAIDNSEEVIKLGPNKCAIIEDILNENIKRKIREISYEALEDGYAFTKSIYSEHILKDNELKRFVNKYNIKEAKEIASLIKYLNEEISGNNNFLYKKNQPIDCLEEAIKKRYFGYMTKSELKDFLLKHGYSKISVYQTMDRIVSKGFYVQMDKEKYLVKEEFNIEEDNLNKVLDYVKNNIEKYGHFIPNVHIEKMKESIDFGEYDLNQYTISNILEENGYRKLFRYKMKNNLDVVVLVEEKSKYKDIDVLAHDIIENEYDGPMDEKDVYDFLAEKGIYEKIEDILFKKMYNDMNINGCIKVVDGKVILS